MWTRHTIDRVETLSNLFSGSLGVSLSRLPGSDLSGGTSLARLGTLLVGSGLARCRLGSSGLGGSASGLGGSSLGGRSLRSSLGLRIRGDVAQISDGLGLGSRMGGDCLPGAFSDSLGSDRLLGGGPVFANSSSGYCCFGHCKLSIRSEYS